MGELHQVALRSLQELHQVALAQFTGTPSGGASQFTGTPSGGAAQFTWDQGDLSNIDDGVKNVSEMCCPKNGCIGGLALYLSQTASLLTKSNPLNEV